MIERRFVKGAGVRATKAETPGLEGYSAVFNEEYVLYDSGSYRVVETVMPGTFTRALEEHQDVRCCLNHDANQLLGRTAAGTLRLKQDDKGLSFVCDLPDTTIGRDVRTSIERGDLSGCSFAFSVTKQSWSEETKDGKTTCLRRIEDVDLFEQGPVTFPAYEGTSVGARSEMRSAILSIDGLPAELRARIEHRKKGDDDDGGADDKTECNCRCDACADCTNKRSAAPDAEMSRGQAEADVEARLRRAGLKAS